MADESPPPFYSPNHRASSRPPTPGVPLFSFRTADHRQVDADLVERPGYGFEARFFIDASFSRSRRFGTREGAVQWAEAERAAIERGQDEDFTL